MSQYVCATCTKEMREERGCHGGSKSPLWYGSEHETDTCPRRLMMRDPEIGRAMAIYNHTAGKLGLDVERLPCRVVEAVHAVGLGVDQRRREDDALDKARRGLSR